MSSKSSKNRVLVICNGYEMRKGRATKTMQVWRCLKKTCNGSAIFSLQTTTDLEPKNSHSCRKILSNIAKRQKIEQLKADAIKTIGVTSGKVVESAKDMLPDDQLLALPSDKALKDIVLRQRKQVGAETMDKPLEDVKFLPCFQETKQGQQFLLYDSRDAEPGQSVIFIFLSELGLRLLRENPNWSIDGTFFSVPRLFYQLYSINVFKGETTLPCFYALLSDKTEQTYVRMFSALKKHDKLLCPESIMADFEIAPVNAMLKVFGEVKTSYCLFHLSKNAFAHIQGKSLQKAYEDENAKELLRCLPALAFLPANEVVDGFDEVKRELNKCKVFTDLKVEGQLQEYLLYFEKTYVRRVKAGITKEGTYPVLIWNQREAALKGLPRTNNHIEGWHRSFNDRFQRANMPLSQFIVRLKDEEEKTRQIVVRAKVNPAEVIRQPRRPAAEVREANIKILVEEYKTVHRLEFLKTIQHHLARFAYIRRYDEEKEVITLDEIQFC